MARHIGIVGCSAEGAALCYRTICTEAPERMGRFAHPEVSMHTHSFARYMDAIAAGDWHAVAALMLDSARKLARAGAELLICPDNTVHQAMGRVEADSPLPWLHIAREVVAEARRRGCRRLAVLGTTYLMAGPVYRDAAGEAGIEVHIPQPPQQQEIHRIIFEELVGGAFLPGSRRRVLKIIAEMKARGCDAAVLGCTELPLLVHPPADLGEASESAALPMLDSTRLLARAAVREALG